MISKYQVIKILSDNVWDLLLVKKNTYNSGHNIMELSNVLVHLQFPTSQTKLDI